MQVKKTCRGPGDAGSEGHGSAERDCVGDRRPRKFGLDFDPASALLGPGVGRLRGGFEALRAAAVDIRGAARSTKTMSAKLLNTEKPFALRAGEL
jgi:hypothetical protein